MRRGSTGAGIGSDLGNEANSWTVMPRSEVIGCSGIGSLIGWSSASAAVRGTNTSAARTAAIVRRHHLSFVILPPGVEAWRESAFRKGAFPNVEDDLGGVKHEVPPWPRTASRRKRRPGSRPVPGLPGRVDEALDDEGGDGLGGEPAPAE